MRGLVVMHGSLTEILEALKPQECKAVLRLPALPLSPLQILAPFAAAAAAPTPPWEVLGDPLRVLPRFGGSAAVVFSKTFPTVTMYCGHIEV